MSHIREQNVKACMKIFYLTGLSLEAYDSKKGFGKNWISIWSFVIILFYSVAASFTMAVTKIRHESSQIKEFVMYFITVAIFICSLFTLLTTVIKRKSEKRFWKLAIDAKEIFENCLFMELNAEVKAFNRRSIVKFFVLLIIFISSQTLTIAAAIYYGNFEIALLGILNLPSTIVGRIFGMKFIFYVDVLHFFLLRIKQKLSQNELTVEELRILKKAFSLCWKMCQKIEEIFGWGLVLNTLLIFLGILYIANTMCVDIITFNFNAGPFIYMTSLLTTMFVVVSSCFNCVDCSSSIASLIFLKCSNGFHETVESFALQLKHQRIIFEPGNIFEITYNGLVKVRGLKLEQNVICYFYKLKIYHCRSSLRLFFTT